jgi:hypothetical protein
MESPVAGGPRIALKGAPPHSTVAGCSGVFTEEGEHRAPGLSGHTGNVQSTAFSPRGGTGVYVEPSGRRTLKNPGRGPPHGLWQGA